MEYLNDESAGCVATKGLSKDSIVLEAVTYISETEKAEISLHEIARRLGVKPPSLYNHIKNTKELQHEVFQFAIEKFVNIQERAIQNKQ